MSLTGVEKKKSVRPRRQKIDAFVLVVNFGGADDQDSRWGDVSIVPMTALDETPTTHLKTLIKRSKERTTGSIWSVYIDTTDTFPKDEDTRVAVAQRLDEFTNPEIDEAIGWEIADLQGDLCNIDATRIVGKVVYHTEL